MITTTAFREFVAALTGDCDITIMASDTYHRILDNHYAKYLTGTSELLHKEHEILHGSPFMNVMDDLWTNKAKNCIVGVSRSFIDHTWKPRHFALLVVTKNDGHEFAQVAALISRQLMTLYELNMEKMVRFTVSDTAPAARKISKQFETTLQSDCPIHSLNLCIGYWIGLKESVRTQYTTDSVTKQTMKKKILVTKGGAFPEGGALIRKLRALINYFSSSNPSQRLQRLAEIFNKMPQVVALLDINVRVTSASKLLQRSIINYPAFRVYFQNEGAYKNEKNVFNGITKAD